MKLKQLTFSRFIAAMAIVVFHLSESVFPFRTEAARNFIQYFNVLVSYFFVLSGFILTINATDQVTPQKFYSNRFSRIYPLYLFALLLTLLLLAAARTPKDTLSFDRIFLSVFLIQSWFPDYALSYNFPAWSLSVEAFFYLLFPGILFVLKFIELKWQLIFIGIFWIIMQVLYVYLLQRQFQPVSYNPIFHLSTFLAGVGAGLYFKNRMSVLVKNVYKVEIVSFLSGLILCYLIVSKNTYFRNYYQNGMLAPVFIFFIYTIALSKRGVFKLFAHKNFEYLGEISYGIYILHIPIARLMIGIFDRTVNVSPTTGFYIYLPVLIVFSALTFELIEKPSRNFIRNLFTQKQNI